MRVQVTFINGTTFFGHIETEWPNLGDILNGDAEQFIRFRRPNGSLILLNKNSIAYIVEASNDL